jgi:DNA-binding NtrC family response regulator
MGHLMQIPTRAYEAEPLAGLALGKHRMPRILIVSERDSDRMQLKDVFLQAGMASESADNMAAGCESARSGRFGVIFSTPQSDEGLWTRLIDVANQYGLNFEIVLLARAFDLNQWVEAMQLGAFEVLDVSRDLPNAAEVARLALGAGHLRRFRPVH